MNTLKRTTIALAVTVAAFLGGTGIANAIPEPTPVGKWDDLDMTQLEQLWLMSQFFGPGFQRYLNGDGGGSGWEGDE